MGSLSNWPCWASVEFSYMLKWYTRHWRHFQYSAYVTLQLPHPWMKVEVWWKYCIVQARKGMQTRNAYLDRYFFIKESMYLCSLTQYLFSLSCFFSLLISHNTYEWQILFNMDFFSKRLSDLPRAWLSNIINHIAGYVASELYCIYLLSVMDNDQWGYKNSLGTG